MQESLSVSFLDCPTVKAERRDKSNNKTIVSEDKYIPIDSSEIVRHFELRTADCEDRGLWRIDNRREGRHTAEHAKVGYSKKRT